MASQSTRPVRDLSDLDHLPCLLRIDEVAQLLGRSESAVYYMIRAKQLPCVRPFKNSRRVLGIRKECLLAIIEK